MSSGSSLPEIESPECGRANSADPKATNKTIFAQHRNPTVELIPDGVDPRLLNSLFTLNYHELLPVMAPTDLSLEDPRLVMVGLRTCHADRGRQPVFCLSKHTGSIRSRSYFMVTLLHHPCQWVGSSNRRGNSWGN
jgi:hypothetical protein